MKSIYPTTIFRVSLKAVIENERGEVLCVKENGSDWTLPGGGLDHGESVMEGFARELREEVSFDIGATYQVEPIGHDVMFIHSKQAWQLWVLFRVTFKNLPKFSMGPDADALAFIDPQSFQGSTSRAQQLIYKWCVDRTYTVTAE